MTTCPTCGKPVDPLRAPAVGVRDGKVVSYCSRECAQAAESKPIVTSAAKPRARTEPPVPPPGSAKKERAKSEPTERAKSEPSEQTRDELLGRRTPGTGVPKHNVALDSGPVIEIVHEPASGVVTSAADARSGKAATSSRAETSGAIQIADTGHLDDYVSPEDSLALPVRGSRAWVVIVLLLLLGGGAFAAYQLGYLDSLLKRDSHAAVPPHPVTEAAADAMTADAAPAPASAVDRATEVLHAAMKSDSPRVQRVAASALARTGDAVAISHLAAMLAKETSDLAKLDIQYALARAGDKRGVDGLVAALGAPRRDIKLEAARRLALLGDKRAIDTLASYLEVSQLRLGAAEQLAYLAEPRAVKVLQAVQADASTSADDKARAAIALGHAGKTEVTPALEALLGDPRFNAFAAGALADLHDAAARPVLIRQLDVSALRVSAARALRKLDPGIDPRPLLAPLVAALASAKDTEQVQAAEAVLILAGPASWAEHE